MSKGACDFLVCFSQGICWLCPLLLLLLLLLLPLLLLQLLLLLLLPVFVSLLLQWERRWQQQKQQQKQKMQQQFQRHQAKPANALRNSKPTSPDHPPTPSPFYLRLNSVGDDAYGIGTHRRHL